MSKSPTKAFVLPIKGREAESSKIKELITKAGCEVICDKAKPADYEKCISASDAVVILICPEAESDPEVDKLIALARREGKRVVGVWIPGVEGSELLASINKHGAATITLDLDAVRRAICAGESVWMTPDGNPRPAPKTPRHKG